jgi:D-threo-aldose 1-dehydrogenase
MEPLDAENPPSDLRQGGLPFQPRVDYSAEGARRSLEQSMMRLGMAAIDMVLIHDVDLFTHGTAEAVEARYREVRSGCYPFLARLRDAGVITAIGVGLNETAMSLRFARDTDIDCILLAGRYTLLDQDALDELMPLCRQRNIAVILGGPFNSGVLATGVSAAARFDYGPVSPAIADRVKRVSAIAGRHGVAMPAAALQFPLAHDAVKSVVAGAMSAAEVEANVAHIATNIPADFWAELQHERLLPATAPVPPAGP